MREGVLPIVGPRDAYRQRVRVAFGLWLDYDWRRFGWYPDDPSKNYFTPAAFKHSLGTALAESDEFVWVYGETAKWWKALPDRESHVPKAYVAALRRLR